MWIAVVLGASSAFGSAQALTAEGNAQQIEQVANPAINSVSAGADADADAEHEALLANPYASSGSCGVERWSVKTGTDPDAGLVNVSATVPQTISYLRGLTAPPTPPANSRVQPTEITVFVVNATLLEYKLENDSDYHLVIQDAQGNTMIAEIPDPACVGSGSPFASSIQSARQTFDSAYTATTSFQTANIPVQLSGVGFFDFQHGQTGVAPNAIELHPLLGIVFNPGTGGTPDFALSASPSSVGVNQGTSTTITVSVLPQNGFSNNVAFAASGLPTGVTASFSPTSSASSSALTLTASSAAATGPATVTITGTSASLSHATTLTLTVNAVGGGGGAQTARYDSALKAPWCATVGVSCDSGPTLLLGRGTLSGGTEPNQPNTINTSCADGASGTFHSDESNDRLVISSTDGGPLTAGRMARVTATVWAYDKTSDALDLYSAANANSPSWVFLNTITPSAAGAQPLSSTFVLPSGSLQAVRAHFRYQGSASPCSTGAYDESDDLIFAVATTVPTPDFSLSTAPTSVSLNPGASGTSTVSITSLSGFNAATNLSASGLPSGVSAAFSTNPVTPGANGSASSTLTLSASSATAAGTNTVTITGTSGALAHTTTLSVTVNAVATPDFSLTASPNALSIAQGTGGATTIGVTPKNGFSSNVALSVTGLPSGVTASFNPSSTAATSTLTLSAGNTATTGTATLTISGTSGSLSHSTTLSLNVTAGGGGSSQLLGNSGFETGTAAPWSMSAGTLCSNSSCSGETAHGGFWFAWLDGYGSAHTETLSQSVSIPSGKTTAALSYYLHIDTAETTTTTAYDTLTVQVLSSSGSVLTTLATFSNVNAASGYAQHTANLSAYIGQTVTVKFTGTEDASNQTSFVLDDLTLTVQ